MFNCVNIIKRMKIVENLIVCIVDFFGYKIYSEYKFI